MEVEPVVLLGGQGEQRLLESPLHRAEHLAAGLLLFGALLLLDEAQEFVLNRFEFFDEALKSFILNNAAAGSRRKIQVRGVDEPLQIAAGPRRRVQLSQTGEAFNDASALPIQSHHIALSGSGQI